MKKKMMALAAASMMVIVCLLGMTACGSSSPDTTDIQGEWKVHDSKPTVTVVFTDKQWKVADFVYDYTLDTSNKKISYELTSNNDLKGEGTYEFSEDRQTFTLTEQTDEGKTQTTVFDKVSDNTSAEPTSDGTADNDDQN